MLTQDFEIADVLGREGRLDVLDVAAGSGNASIAAARALSHGAREVLVERRDLVGDAAVLAQDRLDGRAGARLAAAEADKALAALTVLPPSTYRDGLAALARFAIERTH